MRNKKKHIRKDKFKKTAVDYSHYDKTIEMLNNKPSSSLDKVSNLINEFNSKASKDLDNKYIHQTIDYLSYLFFTIPYSFNDTTEFWRVRPSACGELFNNTNDLKYPPNEAIREYGRANISAISMFYAATSPETAFAECRLNKDDYFHLTKYTIKQKSTLHIIVIGDIDNLRRRKKTVHDTPEYAAKIDYILSRLNPDIRLAVQLVDAFFVDRLSRKGSQDEYRVTSRIINELLEASDLNISGVMYESVEHAGGFNYAFKPSCYEEHIVPIQVSACQIINKYGYGAYKTMKSIPIIINEYPGEIPWPDVPAIHEYRNRKIKE
ncbi:MAG: RES family NAD+ phosphorylase [Sulfurimonas sp.]|nr:RES family NAD+ phosphorylase [Sulfurimonas sp.]